MYSHRLAIMDAHASAMQPLTLTSLPNVTLLYNGEIYNHAERECAATASERPQTPALRGRILPSLRNFKCK